MVALKLLTRIIKKLLSKAKEPADCGQGRLRTDNFDCSICCLSTYLVPFSLIARLFTAMFCFDKQLTILITVSIKKTEKWAMASFQLRPVYTTIIYCKKLAF